MLAVMIEGKQTRMPSRTQGRLALYSASRRKQKQFAMLVARLPDMLWLLQGFVLSLFTLIVRANENGMSGYLSERIFEVMLVNIAR